MGRHVQLFTRQEVQLFPGQRVSEWRFVGKIVKHFCIKKIKKNIKIKLDRFALVCFYPVLKNKTMLKRKLSNSICYV